MPQNPTASGFLRPDIANAAPVAPAAPVKPPANNGNAGAGAIDALSLFRRLTSDFVSTSFQQLLRDQFGGQVYLRSNTTLENLSTQLGYNAIGSGNRSTAVGSFAYAREDSAIALGVYSLGLGPSSIAIGDQALALAYRSISIGNLGYSSGLGAISIGFKARATGKNAIAIGSQTAALYDNSIALGVATVTTSTNQMMIGNPTYPISVNISGPRPWIDVMAYGARGDGVTDDTVAIQFAITFLVNTGGTVFFPLGRYKITSTLVVSSLYPIVLMGFMFGFTETAATQPNASCIVMGAAFVGPMILYTAPNSANRGQHGGGRIEGLVFLDEPSRTHACTAVLELNDFALSSVSNCQFQRIKGRAILGEFMVMSEIVSCAFRYMGDTNKPTIDLPSSDVIHPAQSLSIRSNRLEVNYNDTYIKVGFSGNSNGISIIDNRFEAETADSGSADDSNQFFIDFASFGGKIIGNNFNRNAGTQVVISSKEMSFLGNTLIGGAFSATAVLVTGNNNTLTGNTAVSQRTGLEFDLSGINNALVANAFYFAGGVRAASGSGNVIAHNTMEALSCTTAGLGAGEDFWINCNGSSKTKIIGNALSNNLGTVTTVGGIQVYGVQICSGNTVDQFTGTGSGTIGIKILASNNNIAHNILDSAPFVIDSYVDSVFTGNILSSGVQPLEGTATFATVTLSSNTSTTAIVTCTGAVVGDYAEFSLDTLQDFILVTAGAATDQVVVTFTNVYTAVRTLSAGILKVSVRKR